MSKGAYQIGFTKALLRYIGRDEIKVISGASMGLFVAYSLAADRLDDFEYLYRNIDIGSTPQLFYRVFFKRMLWNYIGEFCSPDDKVEIPLSFPVCRIPLFSLRYYWLSGKYNPCWQKYLRAAINFPFLCIFPSILEHRFAIDGGAGDNIPIYPVLKKGKGFLPAGEDFDLLIVLHFDARYDYRREFTTDIPVLDLDLGICNDFKKNHYDFSKEYVDEMISRAEDYGEKICARLFAGECTREELQDRVDQIFIEEHALRQKNISVDRLFSMLNYLGKALRNDATCHKNLF